MTHTESLAIQAAAACVFIVAFAWTAVRLALLAMIHQRYLAVRERRGMAGAPPSFGVFAGPPLLLASILVVPSAVVFAYIRATEALPTPAVYAAVAVWPVVAIVLLVRESRSPWSDLRAALTRVVTAKEADRHDLLERAADVEAAMPETQP